MNAILRILLLLLSLQASSFGEDYDSQYAELKNKEPSDESQVAAAQHAEALFKLSDKELERLIKERLALEVEKHGGDEESSKLFLAAHKSWIEFRAQEADYMADETRGGSISREVYYRSLDDITRDRIRRVGILVPRRSMELGYPEDREKDK